MSFSKFRKYLIYLQGFADSPKSVGTVFPSSATLCSAMVQSVTWGEKPLTIAEFGAGEGVLSRHILRKMRSDDRLFSYEINPIFFSDLKKINDPKFTLVTDSAESITLDYDVIFSCLPFLSLPKRISLKILKAAQLHLIPKDGTLILFQYTRQSERLLSRYFEWERKAVLKNFPPAYVYTCTPKK